MLTRTTVAISEQGHFISAERAPGDIPPGQYRCLYCQCPLLVVALRHTRARIFLMTLCIWRRRVWITAPMRIFQPGEKVDIRRL